LQLPTVPTDEDIHDWDMFHFPHELDLPVPPPLLVSTMVDQAELDASAPAVATPPVTTMLDQAFLDAASASATADPVAVPFTPIPGSAYVAPATPTLELNLRSPFTPPSQSRFE
jgi:hypothetical protein